MNQGEHSQERGVRPIAVAVLAAAVGSLLLFPLPPLGAYVSVAAVLLWRWLAPRLGRSVLRSVTRVIVWSALVVNLVWLSLAVGLCGPRVLVLTCEA